MNLLADWQWGAIATAILALLTLGGFIIRQNENNKLISINTEKESLNTASDIKVNQLEKELEESKEEAELCLLQLHQVQEELEHYFLLSQDLQQKIDNFSEITDQAPNNKPQEISDLRTRLASLIERNTKKDMQIELLLNRQRSAILRAGSALKRAPHKPKPLIESKEEITFL